MFKFLSITAGVILSAGEAFASSGGAGSLLSSEMLFKGINFLIMLILLHIFAKKPLSKMLSTMAKNAKAEFDESRSKVDRIREELDEYNKKFECLDQELREKRQKAQADMEAEQAKIIEDAKLLAANIERQTETQIDQELSHAKKEIRVFLADEAVRIARELTKAQMNATRQKALMEDYGKLLKKTG
ncbi:MAG: ATP synthase F0 subunit B [Deltaproteobacteria bacterium]|nr:ATP synthase F0 subunit B [Deltaproteobacteria bacterium]